jgi:hypothetical protein
VRTKTRKRKARPILAAVAAAAALSAVAISGHQQGSIATHAAPPIETSRNAAGAVVVRDPETGELREPTPQELLDLQSQPDLIFSLRAAQVQSGPQPIVSESGLQGLQLGEEQMTFTVATRRADGTVGVTHAAGKTDAEQQVRAGARGLTAGKEQLLER